MLSIEINSYFIASVAGVALVGLCILISKIRKYRYFHSKAYLSARESLIDFVSGLEKFLSSYESIPEEGWEKLRGMAETAALFFEKKPYRLPQCVLEALEKFSCLSDFQNRHRLEVDFSLRFLKPLRSLLDRKSYISRKEMNVLVENGRCFIDAIKRDGCIFTETETGLDDYAAIFAQRDKHNKLFVEHELENCRDFFNTLARYPLDDQQRECCVVDDDSALVIAGAGSGKTSVIMSKVAYLIDKRGVDPSSILLISFTNKAADEMTSRIEKCLGKRGVEASTFHKFGLQILKKFSGKRYDIADDMLLQCVIHSALTGDGKAVDAAYVQKVVEYFAYYFNPDQSGKRYDSFGELIDDERAMNLETLKAMTADRDDGVTLNGEHVKSLEETFIANYLFLNGVKYEYEKKYPKEYEDDGQHRSYHPDFYLPEYDIYLEHYAIDEKGNPPPYFSSAEGMKYISGMEWKRHLHKEHGNKYIESFSWWNAKNKLFENLRNELDKHGVVFKPLNINKVWEKLCKNAQRRVSEFEKLLAAFIALFKSNGFGDGKFDELLALDAVTEYSKERQRLFLEIARRLFNVYQKELEGENIYDFNDMINKATEIVQSLKSSDLPYRYIIVDEYQDASVGRMRLLKTVMDKTDAHLFCVGDDWQSIFRFAGSDINLFTAFSDYFGPSVEMKIENTYRNSQELIDIMGRFVMKNPGQIRKRLKSNLRYTNPIGLIFYQTGNKSEGIGKALDAVIRAIVKKSVAGDREKTNIMLLGRTKYDEMVISYGQSLTRKGHDGNYEINDHPEITCQFLTVHKAKGLEADHVVLLNAKNDLLGFPNLIADDPILQLVLAKAEKFDYAEERRLFYVALTRTRNNVYLLVPDRAYSPFIDDLDELGVNAKHFIGSVGTKDQIACPKCRKGNLIVRKGAHGEFMTCSNFPRCDYKIAGRYSAESRRCKVCGNFMVERQIKNFTRKSWYAKQKNGGSNVFWGCANYPYCNYTERC